MRFLRARLQDFRNIAFADLALDAGRCFFVGANGQGKSNLLEALGMVTALRSFRTQGLGALPRHGCPGFALFFEIEHERFGRSEVELRVEGSARRLWVDGERVTRLADFIGRFPAVPLISNDLMLLRGSPGERRRFIDLSLSSVDGAYFAALRQYHHGVAERNRLLKKRGSDAELAAFEAEIAPHALTLLRRRRLGVERLAAVLSDVYEKLAEKDEGPSLRYQPNLEAESVDDARRILRDSRERDRVIGSTRKGPHRDEFVFELAAGGARDFASDGQQRGLCVALRLAQARLFREDLGVAPVLLADDVLGELDPHRREGFWRACPGDLQILGTGTEPPPEAGPSAWRLWKVAEGAFQPADDPPAPDAVPRPADAERSNG